MEIHVDLSTPYTNREDPNLVQIIDRVRGILRLAPHGAGIHLSEAPDTGQVRVHVEIDLDEGDEVANIDPLAVAVEVKRLFNGLSHA